MPRWLTLLAGLGVIVAGAVWLAGRGDSSPSALLGALRADPLASYAPPNAKLVRVRERDQGSALGKPFQVELGREFEVTAREASQTFDAVQAFAIRSGWRLQGEPVSITGASGRSVGITGKRIVLGGREATLTIVMRAASDATSGAQRTLDITVSSANSIVDSRREDG